VGTEQLDSNSRFRPQRGGEVSPASRLNFFAPFRWCASGRQFVVARVYALPPSIEAAASGALCRDGASAIVGHDCATGSPPRDAKLTEREATT